MTGYESKRAAAQAKTIDEVNWVDHEPNGLVQPTQEPVAYLCKSDQHGLFDRPTPDKACKDCFPVYAAPPQPAQEPWRESASDYERGVIDGRQMQAQSSVDKAVNAMTQPTYYIPSKDQRPWVGLTDEERKKIWNVGEKKDQALRALLIQAIRDIEAKLKEKNSG